MVTLRPFPETDKGGGWLKQQWVPERRAVIAGDMAVADGAVARDPH